MDALLNYTPLATNVVVQLTRVPNGSVRVMLARNPHLTHSERQVLWQDKDEYVRRGLAENLRLTHDEMAMVVRGKSNTVLYGLAGNPAAPPEILLQVFNTFQQRGVADYHYIPFAWNPNCPQKIIDSVILKSGVGIAGNRMPEWVRFTRERKEKYKQLKANGKPFPRDDGYPWMLADLWWRDE